MTAIPAEVQALADQRLAARAAKDWALSDELRTAISDAGWIVADISEGYTLTPKPLFSQFATLAAVPESDASLESELVSIDLIVDGWPEDVTTCVQALCAFMPSNARISVLELGNVDGAGEVLEKLASADSRISVIHVAQTLSECGWAAAVTKMLRINNAAAHVVMDISTVLSGDAITPLVDALGGGVVVAGWRGVNVNLDDEWRSFSDAAAGEVDAVLSYLFAVDTAAARATGPDLKAKFYRNADLEWSLRLRLAGGKVVMPTNDLPCAQARHHGYHDTDSVYRDRESRKTYDRLLKLFRHKPEILAPRH